jgi:uncharacterized membrane protein
LTFAFALVAFTAATFFGKFAATQQAAVSETQFADQVAPILSRHCSECHSADSAEMELDLSSPAGVLRGSETGPVALPGKANESLLIQVLAADADPHMPPEGQLAREEVAAIARWIDSLAPDTQVGSSKISDQARSHWAPFNRSRGRRFQE